MKIYDNIQEIVKDDMVRRALDDEEKRNIPIIAMSANVFAEYLQKSREFGMNIAKNCKYI